MDRFTDTRRSMQELAGWGRAPAGWVAWSMASFLGSYFICRLADDLVAPAQLIWVTSLHQQKTSQFDAHRLA